MAKQVRIKKEKVVDELFASRHSASHVLAMAVVSLFKDVKLGIGPVIENGFYYDFLLESRISEDDLPKIENRMREIANQDLKFVKESPSKIEAKKIFKDQPFKIELIEEIPEKEITIYKTGKDFVDLCAGPHVASTKSIGAFKLTHVAGAYWKGSEKNPQMQRIYGVSFKTQKELDDYLAILAEAEKRDHKKLGPALELFMMHATAPGMPYWLPKGLIIYNELLKFWREEHEKRGYLEISSPLLNKKELYDISGHWEHYKEHMFIVKTEEKETYALKPMNCPNAMIVYASKVRSYRDLPLRLSDVDVIHRFELSGTLNGLLRVRKFAQDDAHIFVTEDQIKDEYSRILEIAERFYSIFNMGYSFRLGTRPENFMGDKATWDKAEKDLKEILKSSGKKFEVLEGDGAFYGPKIDIIMKDSLNREWQMGTIQLDFQIPRNFKLRYIDKDNKMKTPITIHRVIYGSLERFIGILIEHYAGAFPVWLSPVQVNVLPIADRHFEYAKSVKEELANHQIRVETDVRSETLGAKIRDAEMQKVPYILVIGDKEISSKMVAVRSREKGDEGATKIDDLVKRIRKEIEELR